jgi:hypothetical protein
MRTSHPEFENLVRSNLEGKEISCATAFLLAKTAGLTPVEAGRIIQNAGIKIKDCQLGCFGAFKER